MSADQRRALRRATLVDAALDIAGMHGTARLTVGRLCARAGLNERYFYESFAAPEEALLAAYDEVIAELVQAIVAAVAAAPADSRAKSRAAIGAAVRLFSGDPRKSRLVFVEPLAVPALNSRRADAARAFVDLVVGQARDFYGPAAALRAGSWLDFAAAHLLGGLAETMTAWLRGDLPITQEELVERSAELFVLVADHVQGLG